MLGAFRVLHTPSPEPFQPSKLELCPHEPATSILLSLPSSRHHSMPLYKPDYSSYCFMDHIPSCLFFSNQRSAHICWVPFLEDELYMFSKGENICLFVFWNVSLLVSQLNELAFLLQKVIVVHQLNHKVMISVTMGPRAGHKNRDLLIWRLCHPISDTQLEDTVFCKWLILSLIEGSHRQLQRTALRQGEADRAGSGFS